MKCVLRLGPGFFKKKRNMRGTYLGHVGKFLTILDIFGKMAIFLGVKIKLRLHSIMSLFTENICMGITQGYNDTMYTTNFLIVQKTYICILCIKT